MSPTQASIQLDFPRLIGAKNYPVWKTRVEASLDGKGLRGFIKDPDYQGDSDSDESEAEFDDDDLDPAFFGPAEAPTQADLDNAAVQLDDDDEDMEGNEQDDDTSSTHDDDAASLLSEIPMPASLLRPTVKKVKKKKKYSTRQVRKLQRISRAFLIKTIDDTHALAVCQLESPHEIFQRICKMYEGVSAHGDPYLVERKLREMKYVEGESYTVFLVEFEKALKDTTDAIESVFSDRQKSLLLFNALPETWSNQLQIWKGSRKFIPYMELRNHAENKAREAEAKLRYTQYKGTPESSETKAEKALKADVQPVTNAPLQCTYCTRQHHTIARCNALQRDLVNGCVKEGTVLPANFVLRTVPDYQSGGANRSHVPVRSHPYGGRGTPGRGRGRGRGQGRGRGERSASTSNQQHADVFDADGNKVDLDALLKAKRARESYQQNDGSDRAMVAVVTTIPSILSLSAISPSLEQTWTIDSGCTRHVAYQPAWFTQIRDASGDITVGGGNKIPIRGVGTISLQVADSKGTMRTIDIHDVLFAPELQFNLLSVAKAVKEDFKLTFERMQCNIFHAHRYKVLAKLDASSGLYQFTANPAPHHAVAAMAQSGDV